MLKTNYQRDDRTGFTLVELLVVIGIIGVLVSILLPALSTARRAAISVQCLSNQKSIGQAMLMYSNENKGKILPAYFWNRAGGTAAGDAWAFALVAGRFLPNPHILPGSGAPTRKNILVCPAVRDYPIYDETTSPAVNTPQSDGYDRRYSRVLMPDSEPVAQPITGKACILDIGYGINGNTSAQGLSRGPSGQDYSSIPMQGVWHDTPPVISGLSFFPVNSTTKFRRASETVILFDGSQWNPFRTPGSTQHMNRISGARHGKWRAGGVNPNTGVGNYFDYSTGITNVLFLDGHAQGVPRSSLPCEPTGGGVSRQMIGTSAELVNRTVSPGMGNEFVWNAQQR